LSSVRCFNVLSWLVVHWLYSEHCAVQRSLASGYTLKGFAIYACSVGRYKRQMAEICVKAVVAVADLQRKDVNLELIKVKFDSTCYGNFGCSNKPILLLNAQAMLQQPHDLTHRMAIPA